MASATRVSFSGEQRFMGILLLFVPATLIASHLGLPPALQFFPSVGAVIPLAAFVGAGTESLADRLGGDRRLAQRDLRQCARPTRQRIQGTAWAHSARQSHNHRRADQQLRADHGFVLHRRRPPVPRATVQAALEDYTAEITPEGILTSDIVVWQPDPDGTGVGQAVTYVYRVFRPLCGYFMKKTGGGFSIFFTVTPAARRRSIAWMYVSLNYGTMPAEEVRAFQDTIFGQDLDIVTNQHPEELPLNLADELSLRSDRTSIAYRQWLRSLGMTFGTC